MTRNEVRTQLCPQENALIPCPLQICGVNLQREGLGLLKIVQFCERGLGLQMGALSNRYPQHQCDESDSDCLAESKRQLSQSLQNWWH